MADNASLRIGWIGAGVMGRSMAEHLINAGHDLTVTTRTKRSADPLLTAGATWADSPAEAAEGADVVCVMVGYPADVENVAMGSTGALAAMASGSLFIDFTSSSPSLARQLAAVGERHGVQVLDAPVSGGDVGARNARLSIMVGGTSAAFERAEGLLALLGTTVVHHGGPGCGQLAKIVNQILVAASMIGVSEALVFAGAAGLDPLRVIESVSVGAAGGWTLNNLAPRMLNGDFEPGFYVEHFVKDLGLALSEAESMGLDLPGLSLAAQLYERLAAAGYARAGTQSLVRMIAADSDRAFPLP